MKKLLTLFTGAIAVAAFAAITLAPPVDVSVVQQQNSLVVDIADQVALAPPESIEALAFTLTTAEKMATWTASDLAIDTSQIGFAIIEKAPPNEVTLAAMEITTNANIGESIDGMSAAWASGTSTGAMTSEGGGPAGNCLEVGSVITGIAINNIAGVAGASS